MDWYLLQRGRDTRFALTDRVVHPCYGSLVRFEGETQSYTFSNTGNHKKQTPPYARGSDADGDGKKNEGKEKKTKEEWAGDSDSDGVPDAIDADHQKKKQKKEKKDE